MSRKPSSQRTSTALKNTATKSAARTKSSSLKASEASRLERSSLSKGERVLNVKATQRPAKFGLAMAGGGPFGAIYEVGALMALDEAFDGFDFNAVDIYVGVSAGSFITSALANQIPAAEIYRLFIQDEQVDGALTPETFMRPAIGEYAKQLRRLPRLFAATVFAYLRDPLGRGTMESFSKLAAALPTGLFDNNEIDRYLSKVFTQEGRTNDFRQLPRKLYSIATDLETGEAVAFGKPGLDDVPISKAIQASSALPGLFPPVNINERHYVDGAIKRTLHASIALDEGAKLVIGINPIVPFNADNANRKAKWAGKHRKERALVDGGLPTVLSQTFRALIHSRMAVGLEKYKTQYPDADVIIFEPRSDDAEVFYTNVFSYADRNRVCEYAYQRTRKDLWRRREELAPILAKHGVKLNLEVLADENRRLDVSLRPKGVLAQRQTKLREAAAELKDSVLELERWLASNR
jgi:NTE family protein